MTSSDKEEFDLIVIGTGMTGTVVAQRCAKAGWSVAVVDDRPYGGTCALRGCDPKKILLSAAEVSDAVRRLDGHGVNFEGRIDWPDLMAFKRDFTEPISRHREEQFEERGIATLHGTARFTGPNTLEIDGETFTAEHFVIATGAEPVELGVPGAEHLTTSTAFLELDELPEDIVFVGGGYVSHEFAHLAVRAGARVRILEMMERPLGRFDPDIVDVLVKASEELGIEYTFETQLERIESRDGRLLATAARGGDSESLEADLVVHGAGRAPRLAELNLEAAGIAVDTTGVSVDACLRSTSHPAAYAGGDSVARGLPLTPVAVYHGVIIAKNLLGDDAKEVEHSGTPSVVFTLPHLATVGLTESEADEQHLQYTTKFEKTADWFTSRRVNAKHSAYKVLVEESTNRILGAHLIGPEVSEVINIFALAMRAGLTSTDLKRTLLAYPTAGHDVRYMV